MRKVVFALFLAAVMILAIAGCKEDVAGRDGVSRPAPEASATPAEEDCTFGTVEGCGPDDHICMWDRCWSNEELLGRFSECDYTDGSATECEAQSCDNCASGVYSCYSTGSPRGSIDFCAECVMDGHCKSGLKCDVGVCVSGDSGSAQVEEVDSGESEAEMVADPESEVVDVGSGDGIIGLWDSGGFHYSFKEEGDIVEKETGDHKGTWEHVEGRDYTIYWANRYEYVDDMTLSEDGDVLDGTRRGRSWDTVKMTRME